MSCIQGEVTNACPDNAIVRRASYTMALWRAKYTMAIFYAVDKLLIHSRICIFYNFREIQFEEFSFGTREK